MGRNFLGLLLLLPAIVFAGGPEKPIFNGKNLKGWEVKSGTAEFKVHDGIITGYSKLNTPNTFLVTDNEYTNFVLEYEMKMDEGLNSGVQIRSNISEKDDRSYVYGLQIECEDSHRGWAAGIYDEARRGWRYPMEYNPEAKIVFKKEEWNTFKVIAWENHIMTWINGIPAANLVEEEVETGFIGLQVHAIWDDKLAGKEISWRNIKLSVIDEAEFKQIAKTTAPQVSYLKNELTPEEIEKGWKLLWDGETTTGWRGAKLDKFPEKGWGIVDGELIVEESDGGESENGGDIVTEKKYKDFILELDFMISEGANSGIKYFVDTELNKGPGSSIGCEFQILDDENHPDAKKGVSGNRTMGSLYDLITANGMEFNPYLPRAKYVNGIGSWNKARIVIKGNTVQHFLNGIKVVEYERNTQMWRALVAYSKYRDWPAFGDYESGNILLQDHGDRVKFRSIKIKEL